MTFWFQTRDLTLSASRLDQVQRNQTPPRLFVGVVLEPARES